MFNVRASVASIIVALPFFVIASPPVAYSQSQAQRLGGDPLEHVAAPGGRTVYYITSVKGENIASPTRQIEAGLNGNTSFVVLLKPRPSNEPKQNLDGFSHLFLSPDGKTLYFQSSAWATSDAVHSLDIATKRASYVTAGQIACVVLQGEYQGDLVVEQHRYFVQGGSHDDLYLYEPTGKEIGLVSQGTDRSDVCPSLGNGYLICHSAKRCYLFRASGPMCHSMARTVVGLFLIKEGEYAG
jgi:hypothetical protein